VGREEATHISLSARAEFGRCYCDMPSVGESNRSLL